MLAPRDRRDSIRGRLSFRRDPIPKGRENLDVAGPRGIPSMRIKDFDGLEDLRVRRGEAARWFDIRLRGVEGLLE